MASHRKRDDGSFEEQDDSLALEGYNTNLTGREVGGYHFMESLGHGAFGIVYRAHDLNNHMFTAIKVISDKKKRELYLNVMHEVEIGSYLTKEGKSRPNSQFVVDFYGEFQIDGDWFLVYELLLASLGHVLRSHFTHGLLTDHLRTVTRCIISGLDFMHEVGVIHCDLKPENVVLLSFLTMECKIIDFGNCDFKKKVNRWYEPIQTPPYRAPEVYLRNIFDEKVDVFSAGCVFAECACSRMLFYEFDDVLRMALMVQLLGMPPCWMVRESLVARRYFTSTCPVKFRRIVGYHPVLPLSLNLQDRVPLHPDNNTSFYDLIFKCMTMDPAKRPSSKELLEHPWLQLQ